MVLWPPLNTCRRSIVFGESDAGTDGKGGWDTMVMCENSAPMVVARRVGDSRWAGTEGKLWLPVDVFTVTSNRPGAMDTTWTSAGSSAVASLWRVMTRSYWSPPNRRDGSEVHGDEREGCEGLMWSRRAIKRPA